MGKTYRVTVTTTTPTPFPSPYDTHNSCYVPFYPLLPLSTHVWSLLSGKLFK